MLRPLPADTFEAASTFSFKADHKSQVCVRQSYYSVHQRGKEELPTREELPGPAVTSFVFRVRNVPSALFRPWAGAPRTACTGRGWRANMVGDEVAHHVHDDVEGHPEDLPLRLTFEEPDVFTTEVRILGVCAAAGFRIGQSVTV